MAMTSLSIVLTVFVLQLHHVGPNQKPVPRWIRRVVVGVISRALCMRSHIESYYGYRPDEETLTGNQRKSDDMCLKTFHDNREHLNNKDTNNCNGRLNVNQCNPQNNFEPVDNRNIAYDKISNHLKILVSRHDTEDDFQDIINEWRLVAHIMDRFLFWLFLIGAILSSVSILVFKPMMKPNIVDLPGSWT